MAPTALISVYDKSNIHRFAHRLTKLGYDILSTGGTAAHLRDHDIDVTEISQWTGHDEMLDGRVKTLHPAIHAPILARRDDEGHMDSLEDHQIGTIDVVVVNLYPFQDALEGAQTSMSDALELIDIGGVAMLRAAAKNWKHVIPVASSEEWEAVADALESGEVSDSFRRNLAAKAFELTAAYDATIASYMRGGESDESNFASLWTPVMERKEILRYGENPHQDAALYRKISENSPVEKLHGRALGYNNVLDLDGALQLIWEFDEPTAAVIKHTNPAGCATASTIEVAFDRALAGDPVSAYGGIVAVNRPVSLALAKAIDELFAEIVAAPNFDDDAFELLRQKKRRRLIRWDSDYIPDRSLRSTALGWLVQTADPPIKIGTLDWDIATERDPGSAQSDDLEMAWRIVKHVKSNAIVIVKKGQVLGVGAGQMSRVDAVNIAIDKCVADSPEGAVLASDAFFPFRDGVDRAAQAGVRAIIQPGGSRRDPEVIDACNEQGLAMVMTGIRHFRHG